MKFLKPAIVVCCAIATLIVVLTQFGSSELAQEAQYPTAWMCSVCKHRFDLTGSEAAAAMQDTGMPPVLCPSCRERKAYQLNSCMKCATVYFGGEVPGSTGKCPKCFPEAKGETTVHTFDGPIVRPANAAPEDRSDYRPKNRN
jgi:hypothetical protein